MLPCNDDEKSHCWEKECKQKGEGEGERGEETERKGEAERESVISSCNSNQAPGGAGKVVSEVC